MTGVCTGSEDTTHGALKQMDQGSSRPRRLPLFQLRTLEWGYPIFVTTLYLLTATSNGIMCHETTLECGLHKLAHVNCQSSVDRSGICGGCPMLQPFIFCSPPFYSGLWWCRRLSQQSSESQQYNNTFHSLHKPFSCQYFSFSFICMCPLQEFEKLLTAQAMEGHPYQLHCSNTAIENIVTQSVIHSPHWVTPACCQ